MQIQNCDDLKPCEDTCPIYDLCMVTIKPSPTQGEGRCLPDEETQIICEGFKFSSKLDVEVKTNSACYEGYGYQVSNMQYDWEITNPCDRDWFDRRFIQQICDKYSMEITGYVQESCGTWTAKETLTACIIEETGRDYGKGVTRSLKGKALHRIVHDSKTGENGYTANASGHYKNNANDVDWTLNLGDLGSVSVGVDLPFDEEREFLMNSFLHGAQDVQHFATDIRDGTKWALSALYDVVY